MTDNDPMPFTPAELQAAITASVRSQLDGIADLLDLIRLDWFDAETVALARDRAKWLRTMAPGLARVGP